MTKQFYVKPKVYTGTDSLSLLEQYHNKRVGIVTDSFMASSGMTDRVQQRLSSCSVKIFSDVKPDPSVDILVQGAGYFQSFRPEVIIALGGGSSLDAAKGILVTLQDLIPDQKILLIAIPTTSGSGSEVTSYAVISEPESGRKYPLVSDQLLPDIAILDASLVLSVPRSVSIDTGMDVITHAIEAYVSTNANDFSDALAEKALSLVHTYLPVIYRDGNNLQAREKVHNASCMAGMAFNSAGLGLVHGLAHALGGVLHIPHGKINAMLLPIIIEFNAAQQQKTAIDRYVTCAQIFGLNSHSGPYAVKQLVNEIRRMNQTMGIVHSLKALGSDLQLLAKNRDSIIQAALDDGCTQTNPRKASAAEVDRLITKIIG
ncbi:1-propanol dehydrogenase PduQ [Budvicia diplopodorum]|uniref:1-propanol dehydrogenase PduQ n=1 Tax=Budvicia diplopodorum TaxID=1119056 RepID=UPI0013582C1F|nr:1-propanol dehydrogenase PduQ [Budvicia diplopodorum]